MEREPLDSIEYESTYLELRPARELPTGTTDAPIFARRAATVQVDGGAVAWNGRLPATAEIIIAPSGPRMMPTNRPDVALEVVGRSGAEPALPAGGPPDRTPRVAGGHCPVVASDHLISLHRPHSWRLVASSLLVVVSASLGVVADLDQRAGQRLFVALTGVLLLSWARLAWRGTPRAGPFGADITRGLDRLATALGTFFAIALWARYATHASATFSRTIVVMLCGVGLISGLLAAARRLHSLTSPVRGALRSRPRRRVSSSRHESVCDAPCTARPASTRRARKIAGRESSSRIKEIRDPGGFRIS